MEEIKVLRNNLEKIGGTDNFVLDFNDNFSFGDFYTNIALVLAKKKGKNAKVVGGKITSKLAKISELNRMFEKIEVAGNGFINFWLKEKVYFDILASINHKKANFGRNNTLKGKKIMVEYTQANTHKPFHIGHLRNITSGEAICRLLQACGAKVIRANYQGDVGLHIAKAIWGIQHTSNLPNNANIEAKAKYLGQAYVMGNLQYDKDDFAKTEIEKINKQLYEGRNKQIMQLYQTTRQWSLEYLDTIYNRVYVKFDKLFFESQVADQGEKIAKAALEKGILKKSQGAVIFPGKKYGLHDRVFITKKGVPTYEAKDLGLAKTQFAYNPDLIVHLVSSEQTEYFKVLFKALELIEPQTTGKENHLVYGWVRLKRGKMSSRTGNVILGEWLLDEVKSKIIKKYASDEKIAEEVAVGAVKYSFLKVGLSQEMVFDIEESINIEGNSGPYIQYTNARINSVLAKSKIKEKYDRPQKLNSMENILLRGLLRFPSIVSKAGIDYSPNIVSGYLFDLAQKFNTFYNRYRIIGSENESFRLILTQATGQVIKNGLGMLAIKTPRKM